MHPIIIKYIVCLGVKTLARNVHIRAVSVGVVVK